MNKARKIVILLGDGMADLPIASLGNKTPLQHASIPNMDRIARQGIAGLAQTVPEGMSPEAIRQTFRFSATTRRYTTREGLPLKH